MLSISFNTKGKACKQIIAIVKGLQSVFSYQDFTVFSGKIHTK